jgi:hypothetical protein
MQKIITGLMVFVASTIFSFAEINTYHVFEFFNGEYYGEFDDKSVLGPYAPERPLRWSKQEAANAHKNLRNGLLKVRIGESESAKANRELISQELNAFCIQFYSVRKSNDKIMIRFCAYRTTDAELKSRHDERILMDVSSDGVLYFSGEIECDTGSLVYLDVGK